MQTNAGDQQTQGRHGTALLWTSTVVAALGSFLFGFDTGVISGTEKSLVGVFHLSDSLWGFTVSIALIGTMFGSFMVGRPSDWWGRRKVLAALAVTFLVSAVGCAAAWNWSALLFFRFLGGLAVGGASVASPMYIAEIAPANRRGLLTATSQLNIVLGFVAAYLSNYVVSWFLGAGHADVWRWMLGIMIVPSVAFLVTVLFIPESPRWLVRQGREAEATRVLARFGNADPARETAEIVDSLREERRVGHQHLFQRKYLRPLLLACMIAAFGQLDGINAIAYYTPRIFAMAGYSEADSLGRTVIIGLTNLSMTLVGLVLIDRVGRKALLLVGCVTFVISHALAAWIFYTNTQGWPVLVALMGIQSSHAFSVGAVIWACINELFPNAVRASGSAVACCVMWVFNFFVSWSFPVIAGAGYAYAAFGFYGSMMVIFFVLLWQFLPETMGISLEELQKRLGIED
jgi:sugar porter (SP) family MFS transporter